jgi:hypothetical protein
MDPFTRQLVSFVRNLPDEHLLALVCAQLGTANGSARPAVAAPARRMVSGSSDVASKIQAALKGAGKGGLGLGEISSQVGAPKHIVQFQLRQLRAAGRVASKGERRAARWMME